MKIVFLSRYQNESQRGVETFVKELVQRLEKSHTVDIFTGKKADSIKDVLKGKYDVVIPLNGRFQSLKVSLARIVGRYKVLISGHSGIGRDDLWNILIVRPDVFVALTDRMRIWAKKFAFGVRVVKISNGVDLIRFSPNGKKINFGVPGPVILCVGALTWNKQHELAVKAVARLEKGSLVIVGSGPKKDSLEKLAQKLLPGRFKITNFIYEQMPQVYRSADLFTLPSWDRESFGIVYLEAMASNIPVVAPRDESRREIVGKGGILVDVEDSDEFAAAIDKCLTTKWDKLPRQQAEKFNWDKIAKQYENALLDLI